MQVTGNATSLVKFFIFSADTTNSTKENSLLSYFFRKGRKMNLEEFDQNRENADKMEINCDCPLNHPIENKLIYKKIRKIKYFSKKNNAIRMCYSSYEFVVCEYFLEKDDNVAGYDTQVHYTVEGRRHTLDFLVYYKDGSKKVIEVKAKNFLESERDVLQIKDSKINAEINGYKFELWTEKELNIKRASNATVLADEYLKSQNVTDYVEYLALKEMKVKEYMKKYREKHYRKKARKTKQPKPPKIKKEQVEITPKIEYNRKYYRDKTSNEKITFYCEFCKENHTVLEISYERNIKKNNRFICIRENGHMVGKREKTDRKNPYASSNMKKCSKCNEILPLENFSPNGKDQNGEQRYYSHCKKCRKSDLQSHNTDIANS